MTGIDLIQWALKVEDFGAGEILLTSMDADGTKEGYDIPMTKAVTRYGRNSGNRLGRRRVSRAPPGRHHQRRG